MLIYKYAYEWLQAGGLRHQLQQEKFSSKRGMYYIYCFMRCQNTLNVSHTIAQRPERCEQVLRYSLHPDKSPLHDKLIIKKLLIAQGYCVTHKVSYLNTHTYKEVLIVHV